MVDLQFDEVINANLDSQNFLFESKHAMLSVTKSIPCKTVAHVARG